MIPLKKINLLSEILQKTKDDKQLERIYSDALIALHEMGIEPVSNCYEIDEQKYPLTPLATNVIAKKQKQKPSSEEKKETVTESLEPKPEPKPEPVTETNDNSKSLTEKKEPAKQEDDDVLDQFMQSTQKPSHPIGPVIVSRHNIKVINKKNPSDFKEFLFLVSPIAVQDDSSAGDIAVIVDRGAGQEPLAFASAAGTGRKSIDLEVDGFSFLVRGAWKNRKFSAQFYLKGSEYKLPDTSKEITPDETIDPDAFNDSFIRKVGDSKLYVLPLARVNEPNGLAKVVIVQETEQSRQINCPGDCVLMAYIGGNDYRIYAKWNGSQFNISMDVM